MSYSAGPMGSSGCVWVCGFGGFQWVSVTKSQGFLGLCGCVEQPVDASAGVVDGESAVVS